ncbi:hypothetical protein ZWY2020_019864 [Hordeum vulgare]|nr:hypothetical protein ZWY2020_019864 [Hordeum vulgare]
MGRRAAVEHDGAAWMRTTARNGRMVDTTVDAAITSASPYPHPGGWLCFFSTCCCCWSTERLVLDIIATPPLPWTLLQIPATQNFSGNIRKFASWG